MRTTIYFNWDFSTKTFFRGGKQKSDWTYVSAIVVETDKPEIYLELFKNGS